jgi:signal transduction histidine kinase/CheY-like chemotaxis protein
VTLLFNSVAEYYGSSAMAVLLTGMGSDGAAGMQAIARAGGVTIAQNEASCVVFGMPKQAIDLGAVRHVLPPLEIGRTLIRCASLGKDKNGAKILVADDSAVAAAMLSNVLKGRGYDVVRAADGIEAVQHVYDQSPDLILLDIFMPRMNGYQACRLLKDDPAVAHIPIIIMTGSDSRSAESWSLQTGADAFMTKGFDPTELLATVERLLAEQTPHAAQPVQQAPGPEEILAKLSLLMDRELYSNTIERTELRTILQNLTDGVLTLDMQQRITRANPALGRMLGVSETELLGRSCSEFLGEAASVATLALFEQSLTNQKESKATVDAPNVDAPNKETSTRETRDSELHDQSGGITPVAISVAVLHDYMGETVGCVCMFQDFTRRKEIEALYDKLRDLDKAKENLTHMIVHDLRTPLTSVIGGMQTLELVGDLNEDQQEMVSISISGGESLLGMINNLLDISKLEDGSLKLEYSHLSPKELVARAVEQVASLVSDKNLELTQDIAAELPAFSGDEDKLRRTLVNLLGNAFKFTPSGGNITIMARQNEGEDELLFAVRDTGEGIPPEAFSHIFEKFGQVENRQAGRKMSTGLGLTFCKMAVEAHGGRIWVESTLGQGSTFFLTVPLRPVASATESK